MDTRYMPKVHFQSREWSARTACGQLVLRVTSTQYVKDVNCKSCDHRLVLLGLRKPGEVPSGTKAN